MNAPAYKTAVYSGFLPRSAFVPAKLAELLLLAQRMALVAARGVEKNRLRKELAPWFSREADLERMVSKQMPTDSEIATAYSLDDLAREYRQLPYRLFFHADGNVYVQRSPYFAFTPDTGELMSSAPGSRPCYAVPAEWLNQWTRPLFHAPSIGQTQPMLAWKPAGHSLCTT